MRTMIPVLAFLAVSAIGAEVNPPSGSTVVTNGTLIVTVGSDSNVIPTVASVNAVDPNTPEGQEQLKTIQNYLLETMATETPRIRQRMVENEAKRHAEINRQLGWSAEEFDAIKPLLVRVERLRRQKNMVDRVGNSSGVEPISLVLESLGLSNEKELDPSVQEIQKASKALQALLEDQQANATETSSAVAKLRTARQGFTGVFDKAQQELRAVLTPQQEALLVNKRILD